MSRYDFKLPDVGEGVAESEIAAWHVQAGDLVHEDQPLVDMLTDKAAVELTAPVTGRVIECFGAVGDTVAVGSVLVSFELASKPDEAVADASVADASDTPEPVHAPVPEQEQHQGTGAAVAAGPAPRPLASPSLRKRAREQGIELGQVPGTGPGGRITRKDLEHFERAAQDAPGRSSALPDAVREVPVIGLRRKIAGAVLASAQRIPHFSYIEEVDVTELEALRRELNDRPDRHDCGHPALTFLPFLVRALVRVIPEFPGINAVHDDSRGVVCRHSALHCGIATNTDDGLVVPVIRHAERLDLWQLATRVRELAERARNGTATRSELSGSTITITSLGALGGIATTPIINAPEVAIIGVNKRFERAVFERGQWVPRQLMHLSSSFDHRVVDGYEAARFIRAIKRLLECPALLFIEQPAPAEQSAPSRASPAQAAVAAARSFKA